MKESVMSLLESELTSDLKINSDFNSLQEITENQAKLLGFTTEKIIVMRESEGPFMVEFANNLERYMAENEATLEEAMSSIESLYNIDRKRINIVLRESDIGKLNIGELKKDLRDLADSMDHALIIEKNSLKETTFEALKSENFKIIELDFRPTAENMAKYFYEKIKILGYNMRAVTVYETPANSATYME